MDQISDKKNREDNWIEELSLNDAMNHLNERENFILRLRFYEGKTQMEVAEEIHISRLTPRQREILALRYSEGKTQMEVSREIGISQAQVSRLEKSALKSIRTYLSM